MLPDCDLELCEYSFVIAHEDVKRLQITNASEVQAAEEEETPHRVLFWCTLYPLSASLSQHDGGGQREEVQMLQPIPDDDCETMCIETHFRNNVNWTIVSQEATLQWHGTNKNT